MLNKLNNLIAFSDKSFKICFKKIGITTKYTISLFKELYLNVIKISVHNLEDLEVNFFNYVKVEPNNLFQDKNSKNECWIHNPQKCQVQYI